MAVRPQGKVQSGMPRLGIGLLQGMLAALLLQAMREKSAVFAWASHHPASFAVAVMLVAFVPLVALVETGRMRAWRLAVYLIVVAAGLAALAAYDIWRDPKAGWGGDAARIWPSSPLLLCAALGLFVVNQLLEHRERGNALFGRYASHFDASWMRGIQLALSAVFALLVWGVLWLGVGLFDVIHIRGLHSLVTNEWFLCPVLAMAFAAAVHLTDVRPALVMGMRNLCLLLLSWLLPLVVLLGCGFLIALGVAGFTPLWQTGYGASLLLVSVAVTICLVNAAYKDGDSVSMPPAPVRWAGRIAGPMMLVFTTLAAYAAGVRINQYGWAPTRVFAVAVIVMAWVYGAGYSWASFARGPWLRRLAPVNVAASIVMLGVLLALLTPLADPARLAVRSQVARLQAGKIAPQDFDFEFLRYKSGRYGSDALAALAADSQQSEIAELAKQAQARNERGSYGGQRLNDIAQALAHAKIYPSGTTLPEDFMQAVRDSELVGYYDLACIYNNTPCEIDTLAQGPTGAPALMIHNAQDGSGRSVDSAVIYERDAQGRWWKMGTVGHLDCPGVLEALQQGKAAPMRSRYDDLQAAGVRLKFTPEWRLERDDSCPAGAAP